MKKSPVIGTIFALLFVVVAPTSATATTLRQKTTGFISQEKPDWIEAAPIPKELYPTLAEAIEAANLITHEKSTLKIVSPTYEQAHRVLLQNLLMMQRQLHFNPEDLAKFQSRSHPTKFTVDARLYEDSPFGNPASSEPAVIITATTNAGPGRFYAERISRRTLIAQSAQRNLERVALKE